MAATSTITVAAVMRPAANRKNKPTTQAARCFRFIAFRLRSGLHSVEDIFRRKKTFPVADAM